jgi:hypothetical protein
MRDLRNKRHKTNMYKYTAWIIGSKTIRTKDKAEEFVTK